VALFYYCRFAFLPPLPDPPALERGGNLPLTTCSKRELLRLPLRERVDAFYALLATHPGPHTPGSAAELVGRDLPLRRTAGLVVRLLEREGRTRDVGDERVKLVVDCYLKALLSPGPPPERDGRIGVVVPAYGEEAGQVRRGRWGGERFPPRPLTPLTLSLQLLSKIEANIARAVNPDLLDLVVVDCGACSGDLHKALSSHPVVASCERVSVVRFLRGGGRGPALNFGAASSTAGNLCFLHADSLLPVGWDLTISSGLADPRVNCAAFNFGIAKASPPIPGIRAVEISANLRARLFHLPYGDQCICMARRWFEHVGR
jgi:hypothetical protein